VAVSFPHDNHLEFDIIQPVVYMLPCAIQRISGRLQVYDVICKLYRPLGFHKGIPLSEI